MGSRVKRFYMEEDFVSEQESTPKRVKSLMWYVGAIIAAGFIGVAAILLLTEVIYI